MPNFEFLKEKAKQSGFREAHEGETENEYREALAIHVEPTSYLSGAEIRADKPWSEFTADEKDEILRRR